MPRNYTRMLLFSDNIRVQQRLAALLLALLKHQYDEGLLVCSCGRRADIRASTLDIHHTLEGSGSEERKQAGEHYYGVLASKFLADLTASWKENTRHDWHKEYELLCRECHELKHGKCPE